MVLFVLPIGKLIKTLWQRRIIHLKAYLNDFDFSICTGQASIQNGVLNVGFDSWWILYGFVFLDSDSNWNQELTIDSKQNFEKETVMTGQPNEPPQKEGFEI